MYRGLIGFLLALIAMGTCFWALQARREARRRALRARPLPPEWDEILTRNVAIYRHLPPALRLELQGNVQVFLAEKHFEGCGGLVLTDVMRVIIAAEACLLLLNRATRFYPGLTTILVYPHPYAAPVGNRLGSIYVESESMRLGESWPFGTVVLAWDAVRQGAADGTDGQNVVLHEFAHQLDQEDGVADGTPLVRGASRYRAWTHVLADEFARLRDDLARMQEHVLDDYGATNPAEFFAVATEAFFEKPRQMRDRDPELYRVFADYYRLDPAAWPADSANAESGLAGAG